MATAPPGPGTAADCVNACTISLRGCIDRRSLEWKFPALARCLDRLAGRTGSGLAEAVAWLQEVIDSHPVLQEPAAAGMRHELKVLVERLGR